MQVDEGGGTRFTHLNLTVEPKRGRALFWPSVLDQDPSAISMGSDARTTHEALTVRRGKKFAANMWLHQFDFQNALAAGCRCVQGVPPLARARQGLRGRRRSVWRGVCRRAKRGGAGVEAALGGTGRRKAAHATHTCSAYARALAACTHAPL